MLTLRPEQQAAVDYSAESFERRCQDISVLGSGKTVTSVELARALNAQRIVIVGPLHVRDGWQSTFEGQEYGLPFYYVNNKNVEGREAQRIMLNGEQGIFYIGREYFRSKNWKHLTCDFLCYDESHGIMGNRGKSAGAKALKSVGHIGYLKFNSATPFGGNFEGAYSMAHLLWPKSEWDGNGSFARWRKRWAATEFDPFSYDKLKTVGEKNPGEFLSSLPCVINVPGTRLEEPVIEKVYVDISAAQRKLYNEMEQESIAWIRDNPLVADNSLTRMIRLRQITLGVCEVRQVTKNRRNKDTGEMEPIIKDEVWFEDDAQSTKLDTLKQVLADLGDEKVLITSDSTRWSHIAAKRIGAFEWTGNTTEDEHNAAKERFINGNLQYIIAHPASVAEGTDGLQRVCHILIRVSRTYGGVLEEQLVGRLNRGGQKKQVVIIDILARDTKDDPQAVTLLDKEIQMRQWALRDRELAPSDVF